MSSSITDESSGGIFFGWLPWVVSVSLLVSAAVCSHCLTDNSASSSSQNTHDECDETFDDATIKDQIVEALKEFTTEVNATFRRLSKQQSRCIQLRKSSSRKVSWVEQSAKNEDEFDLMERGLKARRHSSVMPLPPPGTNAADSLLKNQKRMSLIERVVNGQNSCSSELPSRDISSRRMVVRRQSTSDVALHKRPQMRYVPTVCAICLEKYDVGDHVTWSPNVGCQHAFHRECIISWLLSVVKKQGSRDLQKTMKSVSCPCCRQPFIDNARQKLDLIKN